MFALKFSHVNVQEILFLLAEVRVAERDVGRRLVVQLAEVEPEVVHAEFEVRRSWLVDSFQLCDVCLCVCVCDENTKTFTRNTYTQEEPNNGARASHGQFDTRLPRLTLKQRASFAFIIENYGARMRPSINISSLFLQAVEK